MRMLHSSLRSRRLMLERLEDRTVPSTLIWTNRGPGDGFDIFGPLTNLARNVIDGVLFSWQRVIDDFNYADGTNTFFVEIHMVLAPGFGAQATPLLIDLDGKPTAVGLTS